LAVAIRVSPVWKLDTAPPASTVTPVCAGQNVSGRLLGGIASDARSLYVPAGNSLPAATGQTLPESGLNCITCGNRVSDA
jgi:hypothetical protein